MRIYGSILVASLLVLGCNKPVPTPNPTVASTPPPVVIVESPTTATPQAVVPDTKTSPQVVVKPTTKGTKTSPKAQHATKLAKKSNVKSEDKSKSAKSKVQSTRVAVEQEAYLKAFVNKVKYVCYRKIVDTKIDRDVRNGKITDMGNFLDFTKAASEDDILNHCVNSGFVTGDDVKEFKGHLPQVKQKG